MAIREVLKIGNPLLNRIAEPVIDFNTPELSEIITDMLDTMRFLDGAGLAAPQIGINKRIMVFEVNENPRYPEVEVIPETVLINPKLEFLGNERDDGWEGCLSIPGMRGLVSRHTQLRYQGVNAFKQVVSKTVRGFHARLIQHEYDHLDGILYVEKIHDLKNFGFEEELEKNHASD